MRRGLHPHRSGRLLLPLWLLLSCAEPAARRDLGAARVSPAHPAARASEIVSRALRVAPGAPLLVRLRGLSPLRATAYLWDVQARRQLARGHRITFVNRASDARSLRLLVVGQGRGELLVDGQSEPIELATTRIPVPGGRGYRYHAVPSPGGARADIELLGFDPTRRLIAYAGGKTAGLGPWPTLVSDQVRRVVVAASERLQVRMYANDPKDTDGDGLGAALEHALGTCDSLAQAGCGSGPLGDFYRAVPNGTRDTDRDGLPDADELLGAPDLPGRPGLSLPAWGADPRHKDVFVEVDYVGKLGHVGLSERDLERVAALYAVGSAEALRNPDGRDGVALHFDVGFDPVRAENRGLLGAWGGSQRSSTGKYKRARRTHLTPGRVGYFRYALAARRGTGQAQGDALTFNHYHHRVPILAHELAHTMGLRHYGHRRWGRANCKPHYLSIMNYLYQNQPEVGFARQRAAWMDPAAVVERGSLGGLSAERLRGPPLELDVVGEDVDWNRDGRMSDRPVRAPLTWATHKSCAEPAGTRTELYRGSWSGSRPALLRIGSALYALWIDGRGQVHMADALVTGPDDRGSCPLGDSASSRCVRFTRPRAVRGLTGVRHLAALPVGDGAWLALVRQDLRLELAELTFAPTGVPDRPGPSARVFEVVSDAVVDNVPSLLMQTVEPARFGRERAVLLLFRGHDGRLWEARTPPERGPLLLQAARDTQGADIELGLGPAALQLGTGETCGVFPDRERHLRFYCYQPTDDAWRDLSQQAFSAPLGPRTEGPVSLAYHRYRASGGDPIDSVAPRGALYLAFAAEDSTSEPRAAWWFVSEWLSQEFGAADRIRFRWRGRVIDQWTNLPPGSGVALYEDAGLSALKALVPVRSVQARDTRLVFLPLADGAYHAELSGGDDFAVMERGICTGIRGEHACGGPESAASP
ncbi:MAG: hypothetical protein OXU20_01510 [Myxococcales bacterium]|nr:hypothetical protein [Myxococcales bacterium]